MTVKIFFGNVTATVTVSGTGTLVCGNSSLAGIGTSRSVGTGSLLDQQSNIAGSGIASVVGSGNLIDDNSHISGSGNIGIVGSGNLADSNSHISGSGVSGVSGSGNLVDQDSHISNIAPPPIINVGGAAPPFFPRPIHIPLREDGYAVGSVIVANARLISGTASGGMSISGKAVMKSSDGIRTIVIGGKATGEQNLSDDELFILLEAA